MTNISKVLALTEQEVRLLSHHSTSKSDMLLSMGINPGDPRVRKALASKLDQYNVDMSSARRWTRYTDEDISNAVQSSVCLSDVLDKLGLAKHGGNFNTIRRSIQRLGLNADHFSAKDARVHKTGNKRWHRDDIFVENSKIGRGVLRSRVLKYNVLPQYVCAECNNAGEWNGRDLNLTVDHINGVNNDNRVENLRWLCPNCHSQTSTFGTQPKIKYK